MLRRMERERRSQEAQQEEEEQYRTHTHTPLFSQPFKRVCGDALSSRIQSMLGDYEPEPQCVSPRALCGPAEPLSPLQTPEHSPSPRRPTPPRAPSRPAPLQKPTAYVRPLDGQEPLRASPEPLQDLKESGTAGPLQPIGVCSAQCVCVLDILQEMTSWPPLLTSIHTPDTEEPQKSQSTAEETHGHTALKTLELSGRVELELQEASSCSSDSDSSSDSDNEKSSSPVRPLSPEDTHTQKGNDWPMGRWYRAREHQLSPGSPRDVIVCHDAPAQPADSSTHTDRRRTVVCETLLTESTHTADASTHTHKHRRKESCQAEQRKSTTGGDGGKHTGGKAPRRPLLVKIQLNLLSRVPREPDGDPHRTCGASARKRTAEAIEKPSKKKQKLDKEGKRSSSVQHSQSDTCQMKKRSRHSSGLGPRPAVASARPQEGAEAHGKKPGKSCRELEQTENTGALLPEHRQRSVEDHLKEAKKLKHRADATVEKSAKALLYLEAALAFVQSGVAMQEEPHTHTRSSYTMLSETLELIRFILKLKNYADSSSERDFFILCLRCQALLQMTMFRYRQQVALRYSRTLTEHFQSSSCSASPSVSRGGVVSPVDAGVSLVIPPPVQQMALAYVNITALVLNAHDTWEQAEQLAHSGSGLLQDLDASVGPLSLSSPISALLQYTHLGLQRLRLHTHTH